MRFSARIKSRVAAEAKKLLSSGEEHAIVCVRVASIRLHQRDGDKHDKACGYADNNVSRHADISILIRGAARYLIARR